MARDRKRVVWYEGMTLDPHHLQQWDRSQQGMLEARVRALRPHGWGLSALDIDRERLANGELRLRRCSGILPDGLAFDLPDRDAAPAPRNVQDAFEATAERLPVFLTVPAERPSGGNVLLQGAESRRETRFVAESIGVPDENTGADARRVEVAHANLQLRFGGEPLQEYTTLQIAEVVREGSGRFVLREGFVPACLRIAASERLTDLTRRLVELLLTKGTSLAERRKHAAAQRELSPADVTALGLLATVNTYAPLLNHYRVNAEVPPEALYTTLLALAGRLSAYLPEAGVSPRDFPPYEHSDLSAGFNRMDELIREMLGGARPSANYVQLALEKKRENVFEVQLDPALLQSGQFFLVARGDGLGEEAMRQSVPRKLRIASPENMDAVLRSYTRALPIEHTHRLPVGMPVDERASYFRLQKSGPFWEAIENEQAVALYRPSEMDSLEVTLVAVKG